VGSVLVVVGPVRGEDLVGLAAEQEVESLLEDAGELLAELSIEIGHRPAAELEGIGRILGWPSGRLHDAIEGNLGADDDLPHESVFVSEPRTNGALPIPPKEHGRSKRMTPCGACGHLCGVHLASARRRFALGPTRSPLPYGPRTSKPATVGGPAWKTLSPGSV
jgi:hypothetical protein